MCFRRYSQSLSSFGRASREGLRAEAAAGSSVGPFRACGMAGPVRPVPSRCTGPGFATLNFFRNGSVGVEGCPSREVLVPYPQALSKS